MTGRPEEMRWLLYSSRIGGAPCLFPCSSWGTLKGVDGVEVQLNEGGVETLEAKNIIIATGELWSCGVE